MNLTSEQLDKVKELAGLFLSPDEIAVLIDVEIDPFVRAIATKTGEIYRSYLLGKSQAKQAIRENVVKMARHGSPAAEELAEKYIKDQEQEERNYARKTRTY